MTVIFKMFLQYVVLIGVLTLFSVRVESAKILAVFSTPSIDHQHVFHALIKGLALNGHHITLATPDSLESSYSNVTQIDLHNVSYTQSINSPEPTYLRMASKDDVTAMLPVLYNSMLNIIDRQFNTSPVRKLITESETNKFDLFIGEHFFPPLFAFAELYRIPCIGINPGVGLQQQFQSMENPSNPIFYSHMFSDIVGSSMSFWAKLRSIYCSLKLDYLMHSVFFRRLDDLGKKHFGPETPRARELMMKPDLLVLNMDYIISGVRPIVPAIVSMGNINLKEERPLPMELQNYLDASKNGVIYMSLGSNVQSNKLPDDRRRVFVEAFRDLPYDILWKWEDEELPDRPGNVRIAMGLPQNDVLRHPNVKLFITETGILSVEEAIKYNVPMIGIPFVSDQFFNSRRLEYFNIGIRLDIISMSKEQLRGAVLQILENKKYAENIAKLSRLMHDQPMRPVERAVWWTEYVLRHQGAPHLRSPLLDVSFYEYYMLDVLATTLCGFSLILLSIYFSIKFAFIKISAAFRNRNKDKMHWSPI